MHIRNLGQDVEAAKLLHKISDRILDINAGSRVLIPSVIDERIDIIQGVASLQVQPSFLEVLQLNA